MRYIDETSLDDIALGAAILGTGGGGDPELGKLLAAQAIRRHGPVPVSEMGEVPDDALIVPVSMMGAPAVAHEKLPSIHPVAGIVRSLTAVLGRPAEYTMAAEIGGISALLPVAAAAELGIPLVDADMMGRAFPELPMVIPSIFGVPANPMTVGDDWGNAVVIDGVDNHHNERIARALCVEMGASVLMALYTMTGEQARPVVVQGTLSLAERLGRSVREAREVHGDPIAAAMRLLGGRRLYSGKVSDLARRTESGFTQMRATITGLGDHTGLLTIGSQNEHLVAWRGSADAPAGDTLLASTPDLIMILDTETGSPITTESLRFGSRVTVMAAPCDPRYRSEAALAVVGPRAFGYDLEYVPIEAFDRHLAPVEGSSA